MVGYIYGSKMLQGTDQLFDMKALLKSLLWWEELAQTTTLYTLGSHHQTLTKLAPELTLLTRSSDKSGGKVAKFSTSTK